MSYAIYEIKALEWNKERQKASRWDQRGRRSGKFTELPASPAG
jgi:hypothetical protein